MTRSGRKAGLKDDPPFLKINIINFPFFPLQIYTFVYN